MRYAIRRLSIMLPIAIIPGIAPAQTVLAVANLPTVRIAAKPDYRLENLTGRWQKSGSHKAAMLEHLFTPAASFSSFDHRRASTFTIGGIEVTGETMRQRGLTASAVMDRRARIIDRTWAAGIHADWAAGTNDTLSVGVAANKNKRVGPAILPGIDHTKGSVLASDLTWTHDDHMQLSFGWRTDRTSSSATSAERLVELAQGAPLREQGLHFTASYLLEGHDPSHAAMFGVTGRDARVDADDLVSIGSFRRRDLQASLFLKEWF